MKIDSSSYTAPMNGGVILSSFLGHKGRSGHTVTRYSAWAVRPSSRSLRRQKDRVPSGRVNGSDFLFYRLLVEECLLRPTGIGAELTLEC